MDKRITNHELGDFSESLDRRYKLKANFVGKRIAVLMGGKSGEREVSLRSGKGVVEVLRRQGLEVVPIDTKDEDVAEQLKGIDLVFIALHGTYGEDGVIQGFLESLGLPYTGSGVLASALAMNKIMAKRVFVTTGVPTPEFYYEPEEDIAKQCEAAEKLLGLPIVLKPTSEGSSLGISIVKESDELKEVASETQKQFKDIFFEKYVKGTEVTVGLLGTGKRLRALPVLELVPQKEFYDYEAKYTKGLTEFIIPARLSAELTATVQNVALKAHKVLGCRGMARVDMQIDKPGNPYVTDVNTIPGLTELSDLPAQAKAAEMSYDELVLEILASAICSP